MATGFVGPQARRWDKPDGAGPVTEADLAVNDRLAEILRSARPDYGWLSEESDDNSDRQSYETVFIIDPIDGTRAFMSGQPQWGTLLGLQRGEEVLAGWLHQPTLGHTYVGAEGHAAFHEGNAMTPLRVSGQTGLDDAILLCTHPDMFADGEEATSFARVQNAVRMTRFSGDCLNYGYVATGYADLVIEAQLQPYDVIPLIPIIEHAGGVITDREGRRPLAGGWAIAAATPELHRAALDLLNQQRS